jgi:hypothetical protein
MRRVVLPVLLLLPALLYARSSHAGQCAEKPTLKEALRGAASVFVGTTRAIELPPPQPGGMQSSADPVTYLFDVKGYWRQPVGKQAEVWSERGAMSGGRTYKIGETYLIYAIFDKELKLYDHRCSRTRLLRNASEDLALLGPAIIPGLEAPAVAGDLGPTPLPEPESEVSADAPEDSAESRAETGTPPQRSPAPAPATGAPEPEPASTKPPPGCHVIASTPAAGYLSLFLAVLLPMVRGRQWVSPPGSERSDVRDPGRGAYPVPPALRG